MDASLVEAPKQRNSRDENAEIKAGKCPRLEKRIPLKRKDFAYRSHLINRTKKFPLHSVIARENRRRSKIRKRVEHVFGFIQNSMKGKFIRCIGLARATLKNRTHEFNL